ncbi:hypothetical protein ERO13_A05G355900v2 [Gossypium hirsutum]|uniref:A-kinase anchor protein 12 isoform X1 n=1 Tax=Gossypium hirsutum TaxID=3635 RepID=A0A1U8ILJ5_GOSHI|nr:A-kinase anchor protein 12 isoform X1 [Gossypium hirsutum]KAG4202756.1 hypothetical protein ERO13_A05G355900v2 [Gossypium hirsutum]
MATEAEIIPEPISVAKAEEEISKPSLDLKKSEGGVAEPAGTDECLDKATNEELASNNGVEALSAVSQGNPEISKGESFSMSPEVSVTCGMPDQNTIDDTPLKADKILENDGKMSKSEATADHDSSPEEKCGSIVEETSQNADVGSNKQEANLELKKQALSDNHDLIIESSNEANEIVSKDDHSDIVQEKLEEKSIEETKDTEPEKLPAIVGKEESAEATDLIETSAREKDQIISDSIGDTLTSKVAETSEIKDNETTLEISEIAKKENENPHEEATCMHEPAAEVETKLEEVSKELEEHPIADISSSSTGDETMKESIEENESIPLKLTENASPSLEIEDSKKDTEERTLVEGSIDTADRESAPAAAKPEETKLKEAPISDISSSMISDETLKESKKEDQSTPLKVTEKASSSSELEDSNKDAEEKTLVEESIDAADRESAPAAVEPEETKLKAAEADAEEKKQETENVVATEENSLATTEHESVHVDGADNEVEQDKSSQSCEKDMEISREEDGMQDKVPYEHSETPVPQATDEKLMEKADDPTIESKETGPEHLAEESYVHTEQETGECISVAKTSQDEQLSDLGLEKEKIKDGKPSDEAVDSGDTSGMYKDVEKAIQEEGNLAESLAETEVPKGAQDQIPEVINMNDNEGKSKKPIPELSKSQADETITEVQNQESEKQINEELSDKPEVEQNAYEVTKAVILSEEVEDYSSISKECLKEGDSKEQVEAKNLEVEDHSIKDRGASLIVELEDRRQDQESGDPVSTGTKEAESEEKIKDIVDESKHDCQDKSHEIVTEVGAETSLDNTKVNEELVNLSSVKTSLETCESDANQETKDVENPQHELEKIESALEPEVNEVEQAKAVPETSPECLSQSVQTSTATLASVEEIKTTQLSEKIEEQIQEVAEIVKHESSEDSSETKTIEEVSLQKEEETEPKVVSVEETVVDQGLQNEELKDQIQTTSSTLPSKDELSDAKQTAEICLEKEEVDELGDGKKAETGAACAIQVEEPKDQILASALPEAVAGQETTVSQASITEEPTKLETKEDDKTMETEVKEGESPEKIKEQATEIEGASNVEVETSEKAFDNELIKEELVKAIDEENQCDKTNEIIVNEVSKEEVQGVAETSYLTSEPELPVKDGLGEDELKGKLIEDKASETTQTEEQVVEAQKMSENEIAEKQIVCEDKTVGNPAQASVAKIETATVVQEESSLELPKSDPEGTKGSDNQISRELELIENTEITSSPVKEHVPIDLQDKVAESSEKAEVEDVKEVYLKEAEVGHGGDKITDKSSEEITKKSTSVEDSTEIKELKDEHAGDKTNETSETPILENQNEKLTVEALKDDGSNNNFKKEIVEEDRTVKDHEQAPVAVKEAITVPGEAIEKPEARDLQPEKAEVDNGEEKTDNSGVEIKLEPASTGSGNLSFSDLLQQSTEKKVEMAERVIEERELTVSKEAATVEAAGTIQAKELKTDEVPEGEEQNKTDSGSDAPVMVEAPREAETKPPKKSQNILSGVGSKVKNSISKVKKAITGKSSHPKEPKAISPK